MVRDKGLASTQIAISDAQSEYKAACDGISLRGPDGRGSRRGRETRSVLLVGTPPHDQQHTRHHHKADSLGPCTGGREGAKTRLLCAPRITEFGCDSQAPRLCSVGICAARDGFVEARALC